MSGELGWLVHGMVLGILAATAVRLVAVGRAERRTARERRAAAERGRA